MNLLNDNGLNRWKIELHSIQKAEHAINWYIGQTANSILSTETFSSV